MGNLKSTQIIRRRVNGRRNTKAGNQGKMDRWVRGRHKKIRQGGRESQNELVIKEKVCRGEEGVVE